MSVGSVLTVPRRPESSAEQAGQGLGTVGAGGRRLLVSHAPVKQAAAMTREKVALTA